MRALPTMSLLVMLLPLRPHWIVAQEKAPVVYLVEDAKAHQWCAYSSQKASDAAVQDAQAMTVGTLTYASNHLTEIDLTQTDESGDWMDYDHYFLSADGQIVSLSRLINVLPGDLSITQSFSIHEGKATKTGAEAKQLSTGKKLASLSSAWVPDLSIATNAAMLPFANLLKRPDLRTSARACGAS